MRPNAAASGSAFGQGQVQDAFWDGFLWLAGVVAVVILAVLILSWFRARTHRSSEPADRLLSLDELRRLGDAGSLTVAEYDVLRRRAIADFRGPADREG